MGVIRGLRERKGVMWLLAGLNYCRNLIFPIVMVNMKRY